jgi:phosphoserine phosphatase
MDRPIDIVFFDLDGTLTTHRSSWQFLHEHFGTWSEHGRHLQDLFYSGRISYEEWCRRDAEPWIGRTQEALVAAGRGIPYRDGARQTTRRLTAAGIEIVLLSMGLNVIAERVADELGFGVWVANELCFEDGRFDGRVRIHAGWGEKGDVAARLLKERSIPASRAMAVGDSPSDISLFQTVGRSVAIDPQNAETAAAANCVVQGALTEVLPFALADGSS